MADPSNGGACQRADGVGAGHPPPECPILTLWPHTWLGLEKWEGFSAFAGVGHD